MEDDLAWLPWHPCHSCGLLGERASFSEIPSGKQVRSDHPLGASALGRCTTYHRSARYLRELDFDNNDRRFITLLHLNSLYDGRWSCLAPMASLP